MVCHISLKSSLQLPLFQLCHEFFCLWLFKTFSSTFLSIQHIHLMSTYLLIWIILTKCKSISPIVITFFSIKPCQRLECPSPGPRNHHPPITVSAAYNSTSIILAQYCLLFSSPTNVYLTYMCFFPRCSDIMPLGAFQIVQ